MGSNIVHKTNVGFSTGTNKTTCCLCMFHFEKCFRSMHIRRPMATLLYLQSTTVSLLIVYVQAPIVRTPQQLPAI